MQGAKALAVMAPTKFGQNLKKKNNFVFAFFIPYFDTKSVQVIEIHAHVKKMTHFSCIAKIMGADDLVMQRARASAAMVLTCFSQDILPSAPDGLTMRLNP